jgi:hypothetical protein
MKNTTSGRRWKRRAIIAVPTVIVLGGATMAYASWSRSSTGTGKGKATTMTFTVAASTPSTGLAYPSASATGTVEFSVTNPNSYPIHVSAIAANGSITSDSPTDCAASNLTLTAASGLTGASYDIGAGQTTVIDVPTALTLDLAAPSTCQGVGFSIPLTVTATAF